MENIKNIQSQLAHIGRKLYIVGGANRDSLLGRESEDIDLVSDAFPDEYSDVLDVVGEIGKKYGTSIIRQGERMYELTSFRKDIGSVNHRRPVKVEFTRELEEDAARRDFTCNAIYQDVLTGEYIDPYDGISDLRLGILRFVGNPKERIDEDALRILRAIRFKNKYSLEFAREEYWEILSKSITLLKYISIERLQQEFEKILLDSSAVSALEDLRKIGFLDIFLPELVVLADCPGNKHHREGNVWIHTMMCLRELHQILESHLEFSRTHKLRLLWTILLHDIGKAPTLSFGVDGESHYYQHEHVGAEMFRSQILPRFRFSSSEAQKIYRLIYEHLRAFLIPTMKPLKARKLMMQEYFPDLLLITRADNLGRIPVKHKEYQAILDKYQDFQKVLQTKVFLTGKDIMQRYPELSGAKIGERLEQLNNIILISDV